MEHKQIEELDLEHVEESTIETKNMKCYKCGEETEHLTFMAYDDGSWWDYKICLICGDDYGETTTHPDDTGLYLHCADVYGNY